MAKRRIRTKDQLPLAKSRAQRLEAKKAEFIGIDIGKAEATGVAVARKDSEGIMRILGMEVIENPNMPDGMAALVTQDAVKELIKDALRSYDFRKRHDG